MSNTITTIEQLEELYPGKLSRATTEKETPVITPEYRRLIEAASFFAIASVGPEGLDCSPRGDPRGFVQILGDSTIAFPDRRGNNRLDTLRNIVVDPRVAFLFLIPGLNETLRINGRAHVSTDASLIERFEMGGILPVSVVVVEIETMYFQCARALVRSKLWDASSQIDPKTLPTAGQLVKSAMPDFEAEAYDAALKERQAKTLY